MDFFYGNGQNCFICSKELGVKSMSRIHHCHRCGILVCSKCSRNRLILYQCDEQYEKDKNKPQLVCNVCYQDYQYYTMCIQKYDLKWNHPSKLFHQWSCNVADKNKINNNLLSNIMVKKESIKNESLYSLCLKKSKSSELFLQDFESIKKDVESGRTDSGTFNYSVREFISILQLGLNIQTARQSIQNVLNAAVMYNPLLGYCQGMNYIAGFLLCFCDEEGAFRLLTHMFDHILPAKFYQGGTRGNALIGFQAEQDFLKQVIQSKFQPEYVESVISFVDYFSAQFLLTLLVNPFQTGCLIVSWGEMFRTNSFTSLDQAFLIVLEKNQLLIHQYSNQPGLVDLINKSLSADYLTNSFQNINTQYFSTFERLLHLKQYYTLQSKVWIRDNKQTMYKLKKITNFIEDEIKQIQQEFIKFCDSQLILPSIEQLDDDSDSDEDEILEQWSEEEKFQFSNISQFKFGLKFQGFIQLMGRFQEQFKDDVLNKEFIEASQFQTIFNIFDENSSGSLDFREFLICFSVLLRGSFQQKLDLFFSTFQSKKKKYLKKLEFETLLHKLVESILVDQNSEWVIAQQSAFWLRVNTQFKNFVRFTYPDVMNLTLDPFIIALTELQKKKQRRNTCNKLTQIICQPNVIDLNNQQSQFKLTQPISNSNSESDEDSF